MTRGKAQTAMCFIRYRRVRNLVIGNDKRAFLVTAAFIVKRTIKNKRHLHPFMRMLCDLFAGINVQELCMDGRTIVGKDHALIAR